MDLEQALDYEPFAGDFGKPGDRVFRDKIVTFRKGGTCNECLGDIQPKTKGRSLTMYWQDEGVTSYRICASCTEAMAQCTITGDLAPMEVRFELGESRRAAL